MVNTINSRLSRGFNAIVARESAGEHKATTVTQLLLTRILAAEKYGPVAKTFPILIRHSRPSTPEKKAATFIL